MFAGGLHLNGQEQPAERADSGPTGDRVQAIDRVDQISERLRGMEWTPGVVSALSGLGTVACRHNQELGIRVFEKAYSVAAGIDFDLSEESSFSVLSNLAAGAKRCRPEFGFRSPTGRADSSELEPQASLAAAQASLRADPEAAGGLYIAFSSAALARLGALGHQDILSFELTKQLESWARSHALHQVPAVSSVLGDCRRRTPDPAGAAFGTTPGRDR